MDNGNDNRNTNVQNQRRPIHSQSSSNNGRPIHNNVLQPQADRPRQNVTPRSEQINLNQRSLNANRQNVRGLSDNLRSQTPIGRTLRKQSIPSEPGTVRRDNAPQHFKVKSDLKQKPKPKNRQKNRRSLFSLIIISGLIMYAIIVPIIILSVMIALPRHSTPQTDDYKYQLGPDKNIYSSKIYSYTRVKVGNDYYINMDSLADYCTLTTTGNFERMRYVVRSSGDYVEFVVGQSIAYINGVQERTGGIILLKNDTIYVPMEFAKRCFQGIEITLDEENNKITIIRTQNEDGSYADLSFPYKLPKVSDRVIFADLDADIQEQIIMQNQPNQDVEDNQQPTQ